MSKPKAFNCLECPGFCCAVYDRVPDRRGEKS